MKTHTKILLLAASLLLIANCLLTTISYAQPGSLDNTFGSGGKVITAIGSFSDGGSSVVIQSDGKIVVAGSSNNGSNDDFALVRYNNDGSLDNSFSSDGKVTTAIGSANDRGYSMAIQTDGKIVMAGSSYNGSNYDFALARYNSNGSLDNTLGSNGKITTAIGSSDDIGRSVAIQTDGKIVVAGYSKDVFSDDFALVRYNSDGSLDNTFSSDGKVTTAIGTAFDQGFSVAIQANGKIVVAGWSNISSFTTDFSLIRYNSDGSLDNTFSSDGKVSTDFGGDDYGTSVAIQSDGKIVVAGYSGGGSNYDFALARYNSNGSLDNTLGSNGKVTTAIGSAFDYGYSVAIQSDGKIIMAGFSNNGSNNDFALIRYNSDGSLDNTFGSGGKVTTAIGSDNDGGNSVVIQTDGKIIVAGYSYNTSNANDDFAVVRFNNNGCTPIIFSQNSTICNGQSVIVGSNTYTMGGTYIDTLSAANGCDSIVTTNLTVNSTYAEMVNVTINNGDSIQVGNNIYKATGTYTDTLIASNNCDSIVTTYLTVLNGIEETGSGSWQVIVNPNPFANSTTIQYEISSTTQVSVKIFNLIGSLVEILVNQKQENGMHSVIFDGRNLSNGIYFCEVKVNEHKVMKKLVLMN